MNLYMLFIPLWFAYIAFRFVSIGGSEVEDATKVQFDCPARVWHG
jgi:hypothetical protein